MRKYMTKEQWLRKKLERVLIEMKVKFPKNAPLKVLWRLYFINQDKDSNSSGKDNKKSTDIYDRRRRGSGHFNV